MEEVKSIVSELVTPDMYLKFISEIVQNEGTRNTFVVEKRLKELNKEYSHDVVIYNSENVRGKCNVYYGLLSQPSFVSLYEFKLGKIKKSDSIFAILKLDNWGLVFSNTVRDKKPKLEDIKHDILTWVKNLNINDGKLMNQFIDSLKVYHHYTGQIIVSYREFNGDLKKIKPLIRLHSQVTTNDLLSFGRQKSLELWNREFTCKVKIVKTFWKQRLGTYYPDQELIRFSEFQNSLLAAEDIYDTMLHEMVHWHLHTSGSKYDDEDFEFIEECLRVGCGLSKDSSSQRAYHEYLKAKTQN